MISLEEFKALKVDEIYGMFAKLTNQVVELTKQNSFLLDQIRRINAIEDRLNNLEFNLKQY